MLRGYAGRSRFDTPAVSSMLHAVLRCIGSLHSDCLITPQLS